MRTSWMAIIALAAALPAADAAAQDCSFTAERSATLPASGLQLARIDARAGSLRIEGRAGLQEIRVRGTACASSRALLEGIRLETRRVGNEGEVRVEMAELSGTSNVSRALDLVIEVPETLGLHVSDSSGDLEIRRVGGLTLEDGSGEALIADVRGSLDVTDGSGNVDVDGVRGDVRLRDSSGDLDVRNVTGAVLVENDSSGDIEVARVRGDFTVRRDSSGGIRSRDIAGNVQVPRRR